MTEREALKVALEALNHYEKAGLATVKTIDAITAIKEVLAQPEQEPVAHTLNCVCGAVWDIKADGSEEMVHTPDITPPQRTWVGLTDEEMRELWENKGWYVTMFKAVETKLKEKNNG